MSESSLITVLESGVAISFSFNDLLKYHGPHYPGGVAHALKVMELAFPLLDGGKLIERREIRITTPFPGPGARDAFEMVTRAVTDGRFTVDPMLSQTHRGDVLKGYYFSLSYRDRAIAVLIKPGHVREDFIALGQKADRTPDEEAHLVLLKNEMTQRLLALPASEIYEVAD
ncbi:hypothetical protein [Microvirga sp. VF16]|uniref:hypothetical protein n=1 Tax=Microvirga sp. VF16 TaxID=2807101 RepID=UPI00193CF0DB|nr:hypothetical protein [Microvirga sp. VF16]QRM33024.1 hypothetical protein JO965_27260 [Microvirga sp. VF16]